MDVFEAIFSELNEHGRRALIAKKLGLSGSAVGKQFKKLRDGEISLSWFFRLCDFAPALERTTIQRAALELVERDTGAGTISGREFLDTLDRLSEAPEPARASSRHAESLGALIADIVTLGRPARTGVPHIDRKNEADARAFLSRFREVSPPKFTTLPLKACVNTMCPGMYVWLVEVFPKAEFPVHIDGGWEYTRILSGELRLMVAGMDELVLRPDHNREIFYCARFRHSASSTIGCKLITVNFQARQADDWQNTVNALGPQKDATKFVRSFRVGDSDDRELDGYSYDDDADPPQAQL